jgi:protein O-GlcNAc transferase
MIFPPMRRWRCGSRGIKSVLRGLEVRLAQNRTTYPLFDTNRFRHHIEAADTTMWKIAQHGEPPHSFGIKL